MAKRKIIYESEDDDDVDTSKKARTVAEQEQLGTDEPGVRRSVRSRKAGGGRLAQMKQLERLQTERSRQHSAIDIATQGEEVNPMAPSSQVAGKSDSRKGRATGNEADIVASQVRAPVSPTLQPEFMFAEPGEQFGFRVPASGSHDQAPARTRFSSHSPFNGSLPQCTQAPIRTRFPGTSLQPSSQGPVSSRSASLVSGWSSGGAASTAPTSRVPSVCSSSASFDSRLASSRPATSLRASALENVVAQRGHEAAPTRLQRTASFYDQSFNIASTAHSLSADPDRNDTADAEIDEISPSEDERVAERILRRGDSRVSPSPGDGGIAMRSQSSAVDETVVAHHRRDHSRAVEDRTSAPTQHREGLSVPAASGAPQPSENILAVHRRRNRAPRLPTNSQLLGARQRQTSSTNQVVVDAPHGEDGQEPPAVSHASHQVRPASERAEPWQLQFYDPLTRDIIERAKQFSHCDAASIDAFPVRASFNTKAVEYLDEAIAERQARGLIISDGWWPQNASSITRLLWEDLGNWRSAMRKKARTFVTQRYEWDTENRREQNIEIAKRLLGNGGQFLRDGTDEEGHVNNLAHSALSGLIIDFFYTGPAPVGKLFPDVFAEEVPRVTVAVAATALKVVLDEIASGQGEVNFRVNTYLPVYTEILGLMNKCDTNLIHREKTRALRRRWAQLGSNGMTNPGPVAASCGFDVDLD